MISIRNLHKTYRLGRTLVPVLRGVDLDVQRGELLVILGSSGSGKSTLLHLLGGLDRPDPSEPGREASINVDGTQLVGLSAAGLDRHRSQTVGFVFQFYHLLPELTVLQNVLLAAMVEKGVNYLGESDKCRERAMSLLHLVGLDHRLNHRPVELSGGERQRVAIARALINKPPLLLADEPTGNLDSATGAKVLDTLLELRKEHRQTMVIVTHDAATAERADRVVRLVDGRIAKDDGNSWRAASKTRVSLAPEEAPESSKTEAASSSNAATREPTPDSSPVVPPDTVASSTLIARAPLQTDAAAIASGDSLAQLQPPPATPINASSQANLPLGASQGPEQILAAVRKALQQ